MGGSSMSPVGSRHMKLKRTLSPSIADRHPEWAQDRPSMIDRFKLHSNVKDVEKANKKTI